MLNNMIPALIRKESTKMWDKTDNWQRFDKISHSKSPRLTPPVLQQLISVNTITKKNDPSSLINSNAAKLHEQSAQSTILAYANDYGESQWEQR